MKYDVGQEFTGEDGKSAKITLIDTSPHTVYKYKLTDIDGETNWVTELYLDSLTNLENDVTRPKHYGGESNPHEPIKVIEHYNLDFCLGNAVKYILRSSFKGTQIDDLKKAVWYINRYIELSEKGRIK